MISNNQTFLTPYQRYSRFFEATQTSRHRVFAIPPGTLEGSEMNFAKELLDHRTSAELISELDQGNNEVGFQAGSVNDITGVEVSTEDGQRFMDGLDLDPTPIIWTPMARYYLFEYVSKEELCSDEQMGLGFRILNDGSLVPYPGTMFQGRLIHWELDPWNVETIPLPSEFRCR